MIRRLTLLFVVIAAFARAQGDLTSQGHTTTDTKTGETILTGAVRYSDGNLLLVADEVRVSPDKDRNVLTATGHVILTVTDARAWAGQIVPSHPAPGDTAIPLRLLADKVVFHRATSTFMAERARLGVYPYFAEGDTVEGSPTEIVLTHATLTYGEPGPWEPTIKAAKLIYTVATHRVRLEDSHAGIGHAQPVPLPKIQQGLSEPSVAVVSVNGGANSLLGAYGDAALHVPVGTDVWVGGDLGWYTRRGIMFGPSANYDLGPDGADGHGLLRSGFINDHGDRKTDVLGNAVPTNRGYIEWQHIEQINDHVSVNAQLEWWDDSEVLRDFRPTEFFREQQPDTFVESTYTGSNYFVSLFGRFQPNRFDTVPERLPELRFDLLPIAVGGGVIERFNASAASLLEYPVNQTQRLQATRLDAYYSLSRPITQGDWLSFTPLAGARETYYTNLAGASATGSQSRTLGEIGFDAALRTSGTFDYKNDLWKIDGLRHLFTPRLSYRDIVDAHQHPVVVPPIDGQTYSTYLPPIGLGDDRNVDTLGASHVLRLEFDNTLQTRDAVYGSRDLLAFNIANDFRFKRAPGEHGTSEIHTELKASPARWLDASLYGSYSPRSATPKELNTAVTLHDGDAWQLRFGNNYLANDYDPNATLTPQQTVTGLQDYSVDGRVRLNERYDALARLQYDARKRRFNEQAYGIIQNLANAWRISYIMTFYSGPRRESHFGLNIEIEALSHR